METEGERFMARIGRGIPGAQYPRPELLNLLLVARKRENRSEDRSIPAQRTQQAKPPLGCDR